MTEVFKTNVIRKLDAMTVRSRILQYYPEYEVNFDLEDCDKILRIKTSRIPDADSIIGIVRSCGFTAEILPDEVPAFEFNRRILL